MLNNLWDAELPKANTRTVKDMESVLYEPHISQSPDKILYFMYRALSKSKSDSDWMSENHLRYDITDIPAGKIGHEFVKTKGHYHPKAPCGRGYPELYQVLEGEAHFMLQRTDLSDVCVIKAKSGDVVLIPSGYGHVTINPSDKRLVMANIVSCGFDSEYEYYGNMHGAAYYELDSGYILNPHYKSLNVGKIREIESFEVPELNLKHGVNIYEMIGKSELLEFLNNPVHLEELSCLKNNNFV